MDFFTGLICTRQRQDYIWVIAYRVTTSSNFFVVNTRDIAGDYAKLYNNEKVKFHGVTLSII